MKLLYLHGWNSVVGGVKPTLSEPVYAGSPGISERHNPRRPQLSPKNRVI